MKSKIFEIVKEFGIPKYDERVSVDIFIVIPCFYLLCNHFILKNVNLTLDLATKRGMMVLNKKRMTQSSILPASSKMNSELTKRQFTALYYEEL